MGLLFYNYHGYTFAGGVRGWGAGFHQGMVFEIFSNGSPQGAGPGAMDDAHFLDALHGRCIQQSVHVAQGFLHALTSKVDLRIEGAPAAGPLTTGSLEWAILLTSGIPIPELMRQVMTSSGHGIGR